MNETLEKIMIFINENTNILIGICLFLIFVLIGYLIDNSIKSRKAKKEFKKSQIQMDMQPEYSNKIKDESLNVEPINKPEKDSDSNLFENAISTPKFDIDLNLESQTDNLEDSEISQDKKDLTQGDLEDVIGAIDTINIETEDIYLPKEELNTKADVLYKNDKKLSEILFNTNKEEQNKDIKLQDKVEIEVPDTENTAVKGINSKVEIDLDENELDNIMKKLNNISNIDENDDYTNIF